MVVNNLAIAYKDFNRCFDYPIDCLVSFGVNQFVTGSKAASSRLAEVLSVPKDNVVSLHNGISLRKSTETPEQTRRRLGIGNFNEVLFGVVALMERRKGHQILLDALNIIADNDPNDLSQMLVLLEGDGPTRKQLEEFVYNHQLEERVKFVGAENNVVNFMHALDVVVLPSIDQEDFPNVVLEAMSLGKPVIASRLAGTPEQIVPNLTGYLFEPGDSAALANALLRMANNEELRKRLGNSGRIRFEENFTAEIAVHRYLDLYKELAGV
jgi:glycosyltransferase involved in cell wall biosynthesis